MSKIGNAEALPSRPKPDLMSSFLENAAGEPAGALR
jgi:hypothetical protein